MINDLLQSFPGLRWFHVRALDLDVNMGHQMLGSPFNFMTVIPDFIIPAVSLFPEGDMVFSAPFVINGFKKLIKPAPISFDQATGPSWSYRLERLLPQQVKLNSRVDHQVSRFQYISVRKWNQAEGR